jgi:predicted ATPase
MLQRLYVHNFRCLENFEFKPEGAGSALLIGPNGSGKSTVARALQLLQNIGRGVNRVGKLARPGEFTRGRSDIPMRFELEVALGSHRYHYRLVLDLPARFRELRVLEEALSVDGTSVFVRRESEVTLQRRSHAKTEVVFPVDWHLVALTVIQDSSLADSLNAFRQWLERMAILSPAPRLMHGNATSETLAPTDDGSNFADWMAGLLAQYPASYSDISTHLREVMPDFSQLRNLPAGQDAKTLVVEFKSGSGKLELPFDELSDGEKCFFLCALVLAANKAYGPIFVFWDEPDQHLAMPEVGHFVMALRRAFDSEGQVLLSSHHAETIRSFSDHNTWVLNRKSHLEPPVIRLLADLNIEGGLIQAILSGELAA